MSGYVNAYSFFKLHISLHMKCLPIHTHVCSIIDNHMYMYSTCVICVVCGDDGVVRTYGPIVLLCVVFG